MMSYMSYDMTYDQREQIDLLGKDGHEVCVVGRRPNGTLDVNGVTNDRYEFDGHILPDGTFVIDSQFDTDPDAEGDHMFDMEREG